MDATNRLINETVKGGASSIEIAADFTKWAIGGTAAMAGLVISNASSVIDLIGKSGCIWSMSFLALSLVSGWAAVLASNAVRGALLGWASMERITSTDALITSQKSTPVDWGRFQSEYINLLWGPLRFLTKRTAKKAKKSTTTAELANASIVGRLTSTFVFFSIFQSFFAFLAITSMVIAIWCN